jgi:hypothetical protein
VTTTKKPARATRRSPAKPAAAIRPAAPPAPASGEAGLLYMGGADLSFRDGSGAKRKVLRGATFTVDRATASILLLDPTVSETDGDLAVDASEAPPAAAPEVAPQGGNHTPADDPDATATGEAGTPPQAETTAEAPAGDKQSGAISLGDLPASAVKG